MLIFSNTYVIYFVQCAVLITLGFRGTYCVVA
jgi:hypothetical protein